MSEIDRLTHAVGKCADELHDLIKKRLSLQKDVEKLGIQERLIMSEMNRFPRTIGRCADKLYDLRERRLKLQKDVEKLETQEKALKAHIINTLPKSKASGVSGAKAHVKIEIREEPYLKNRAAFKRYINKTKRDELAYKLRPSPSAIRELWDEGETVPGVEKFRIKVVSLRKL